MRKNRIITGTENIAVSEIYEMKQNGNTFRIS